MATITVGQGQEVTAVLGVGNIYDVSGGALLTVPSLQAREFRTTINLNGGAVLAIDPQLAGPDLEASVHFSGVGNLIAFADSANISSGLFGTGPLNLSGSGFGSTDAIGVLGTNAITSQHYNAGSGLLSLEVSGSARAILLPKGLDPADFTIASADGATVVAYVACFARGTLIATPDGERAVEDLREGDPIRLAGGGVAPVRWIGRRRMRPGAFADPASVQPVAIAPHALAENVPHRELRVSPDHALHLDGVLVPAGLLVNARSIRRLEVESVDYFHVELDGHDVLLAEGAGCETYIDTGNRSIFANAPITALHAGLARPDRAVGTCAPMVFEGEALDAIRARIDARAETLAGEPDARIAV